MCMFKSHENFAKWLLDKKIVPNQPWKDVIKKLKSRQGIIALNGIVAVQLINNSKVDIFPTLMTDRIERYFWGKTYLQIGIAKRMLERLEYGKRKKQRLNADHTRDFRPYAYPFN